MAVKENKQPVTQDDILKLLNTCQVSQRHPQGQPLRCGYGK